jgi:hypothetical protein
VVNIYVLFTTKDTKGRIRYLGEQLKDWVAQLLKALSSGRGEIKVEEILI